MAAEPAPQPLRVQARRLFWHLAMLWQRDGVPGWLARLEITDHLVALANLPASLSGLRLVQLTDLHCGPMFGQAAVERMIATANDLRPDLIVITGDFVQTQDDNLMRDRIGLLRGLRARHGVFGSLGNHDHWDNPALVREAATQAGIQMLDNAVAVPLPGLAIAAVDDLMAGQPDLSAVLQAVPPAHGVILMSHSPGILRQLDGRPWLVLAGHTHGLQWSLPGVDMQRLMRWPLVQRLAYATEWWGANLHGASRHSVVSYRYPVGWFRQGATRMYVCRGVGFLQTVPLRIACPGEIAVFELWGG